MHLARLVGSLGLLQLVNAWVWDGNKNAVNAPTKAADWGLRRNHERVSERLSPHVQSMLNHSLLNPADNAPTPLHLRQPKLAPPGDSLPEVLRRIRCCNAYASYYSLQVFHNEDKVMKGIAYGHCEERDVAIRVGDPIQIQVNDQNKVLFLESNMIETNSLLLLVAYKTLQDGTDGLTFKSHLYKKEEKDDKSATVVTLNLYDGSLFYKGWSLEIKDNGDAKTYRTEKLSDMQKDTVVSIHPGKYIVTLKRGKHVVTKSTLIANPNRLYTILRVGSGESKHVDSKGQADFPNELVVFPVDRDSDFKSAAWETHSCSTLSFVIVLATLLQN